MTGIGVMTDTSVRIATGIMTDTIVRTATEIKINTEKKNMIKTSTKKMASIKTMRKRIIAKRKIEQMKETSSFINEAWL